MSYGTHCSDSKKVTELGLELVITCAAYGLDIHDALTHLIEYGKSKETYDDNS